MRAACGCAQGLPYWGIPLWIIISDATNEVLPQDECAVSGEYCNSRKSFRACFNTDTEMNACDEIGDAPIGTWFTYSRNIMNAFASK